MVITRSKTEPANGQPAIERYQSTWESDSNYMDLIEHREKE